MFFLELCAHKSFLGFLVLEQMGRKRWQGPGEFFGPRFQRAPKASWAKDPKRILGAKGPGGRLAQEPQGLLAQIYSTPAKRPLNVGRAAVTKTARVPPKATAGAIHCWVGGWQKKPSCQMMDMSMHMLKQCEPS